MSDPKKRKRQGPALMLGYIGLPPKPKYEYFLYTAEQAVKDNGDVGHRYLRVLPSGVHIRDFSPTYFTSVRKALAAAAKYGFDVLNPEFRKWQA